MSDDNISRVLFLLVILFNLGVIMWKTDNIEKTLEKQNQTIQLLVEKYNK